MTGIIIKTLNRDFRFYLVMKLYHYKLMPNIFKQPNQVCKKYFYTVVYFCSTYVKTLNQGLDYMVIYFKL